MGLHLFFLPNFPVAILIQGATFIPDSRVTILLLVSTVDAYRFYTKLLFSIRSKVISYALDAIWHQISRHLQ